MSEHGLELWGGVECTVARLQNTRRNQLLETGHFRRGVTDIAALSSLGFGAIRYPAIWELINPEEGVWNWDWQDRQMDALQQSGVRVILGLVHHGSGPLHTNLLDPLFGFKLAEFARRVAERYPWVSDFTPINEPVTTARFSCLYGHWFPHVRDEASFLRAVLHQAEGTALAMAAIRQTIPNARLVVTEDIGKTFGSSGLIDQVLHDNGRRWLSWDLLTGKVDCRHEWYGRLLAAGIGEDAMAALRIVPRPDILGVNYYLTSDRYLDEEWQRYPCGAHGGNGRTPYADVEAVRVPSLDDGRISLRARLLEAWERYELPLAVTEVHNGASSDQQIPWLMQAWTTAQDLRECDIDIRAVTSWAVFGCRDWSSLLMEHRGDYENGAYDGRSDPPTRTALGDFVRELATDEQRCGYVIAPGWWHQPDRFLVA